MCTWCVCSRVTLSPWFVKLHSVFQALTGAYQVQLLPSSPSTPGQRPAGPIDSPKEEVLRSAVCAPLSGPRPPGLTSQLCKRKRKILPIVLCEAIDPAGVRGGLPFEITDNYKGPVLTGPCQYKFPLLISN